MQAVFMIGTQRSGSNLLRLMLGQSPRISAPHPPHILSTFEGLKSCYEPLSDPILWTRLCRDLLAWVNANPVPWPQPLPDLNHFMQLIPQQDLVAAMLALYDYLAEQEGSTHWCNKSLSNVHHLAALSAARPDAKYLHLVRDGRDVACSFREAPVGPKHPSLIAEEWVSAQQKALDWEARVGKGQYMRVHYERLVAEPRQSLEEICDFLALPFTESMLYYYRSEESRQTAASGHMWSKVCQPIQTDGIGRFRTQYNESEIRLFERVAAPMLARLGYEPLFEKQISPLSAAEREDFEAEDQAIRRELLQRSDPAEMARRMKQQAIVVRIMATF